MKEVESVTVLPAATGVALLFVFLALRQRKPGADTVIWSRIDQKTCIKSIASAGLTVHVVEPVLEVRSAGWVEVGSKVMPVGCSPALIRVPER